MRNTSWNVSTCFIFSMRDPLLAVCSMLFFCSVSGFFCPVLLIEPVQDLFGDVEAAISKQNRAHSGFAVSQHIAVIAVLVVIGNVFFKIGVSFICLLLYLFHQLL